jgi:hypothetical protein
MDAYTHGQIEGHLSDEQFTGLLLGTIPPAVGEHLKACPHCAQEAERVSGSIASFEQHTRAWAEGRATTSRPLLAPAPQPAFAWLQIAGRPQMWVAASLAVALAVGIGAGIRIESRISRQDDRAATATPAQQIAKAQPVARAIPPAARVTPAIVTSATLKADNELLSAIDGELSAEAAPSPSTYGLTADVQASRSHAAKRIAN